MPNRYNVAGPLHGSNVPFFAAALLLLCNLALVAWSIYLIVRIAQHVNAWPF